MPSDQERHTLIFDGECRICRRSVEWVRNADPDGRVETVAYQDPQVPDRFPHIPRSDVEAAMQLVAPDGRRWEGARAVERLLGLLPRWRFVAPLFRTPGMRRLAALIYRLVAGSRRRFGCGEHCGLPGPGRGRD